MEHLRQQLPSPCLILDDLEKLHTLYFRFYKLLKDTLFKNIFDFTTAGELDYVAAVDYPHVLHYS